MLVALLSKRSLLGAAALSIGAIFYLVGLPLANNLVEGDHPFKAGQPYVVGDAYQVTPEPGWDLVQENEFITSISKSGATLILWPALPADEPVEDSINLTITALESDSKETWVVGTPQTFVTNAGDHGLRLVSHSETEVEEDWAITNGSLNIDLTATSPDSVWDSISADLDAMVASLVILGAES